MEVYGDGFVTKTSYRTGVLDFGRPVAWSKIRWQGEVPEGTRLVLRTRTGSTPQPNLFWKIGSTGNFERVSKDEYTTTYQVGRFNQIQATYDVDNWSFWSTPYDFAAGLRNPDAEGWEDGTPLLSPGPSQYLQLEVVMFSDGNKAPRIDGMSLLFAEDPAAQNVIAEIWPVETENFEPQTFTYVVRPVLADGDRGFDRLEIFTQVPAEAVHSVAVDGREIIDDFPPQLEEDRIVISFEPFVAPHDNERRIEVVFDAKVLRFGAEFTGWVYDSAEPELKQQVRPGNATFRFAGDALSVRTPVGGELVRKVTAHPRDADAQWRRDQRSDHDFVRSAQHRRAAPDSRYGFSTCPAGWCARVISTPAVSGSFAAVLGWSSHRGRPSRPRRVPLPSRSNH